MSDYPKHRPRMSWRGPLNAALLSLSFLLLLIACPA